MKYLFSKFKGISDTKKIFRNNLDEECKQLNRKSTQSCVCGKDPNNNIIRFFESSEVFNWESSIYLTFLDYNIFPFANSQKLQLVYQTKDMISLRSYFTQNKHCNKVHVINELFAYVKRFGEYRFLHGNLHIDNIFLNPDTFPRICNFFVIDYANAYVLNKRHSYPSYKRSSFMREYQHKDSSSKVLAQWDFITLYVSLKNFFVYEHETLIDLDNIISMYVKRDVLEEILSNHNMSYTSH